MATSQTADSYVTHLNKIRDKISSEFNTIIKYLKERETKLLREVDAYLSAYESYKSLVAKLDAKKITIERTKALHQLDLLTISPKRPFQLNENFEYPDPPGLINFTCENSDLLIEVSKLGGIAERATGVVNYKSKTKALISVCERGEAPEQLNGAYGVAIDVKTGNIYIADQWNNCVKVFGANAEFLFKIKHMDGDGVMNYPAGVAICGNRLLVSQSNNCILNFDLDGTFRSKIGKYIKGGLESIEPLGISFDLSNENIYICDNCNDRILVVTKFLIFKTQFGGEDLKHPLDIKLSPDFIYVLDESDPCVHLFDFDYNLKQSVVSRGPGRQVRNPFNLFIDISDHVLVSDSDSKCVTVFNAKFELIHKIPVSECPMGVAVDNQSRVVVVCQDVSDCLQIF